MRFTNQLLSLVLASSLALAPLRAQSAEPVGSDIEIHLAESDGPQIPAGFHTDKGYTVLVTDGSGAPVSDAAVIVRLPDSGSTGTFADGTHSAIAYTDAAGRAHIANIQWNKEPGPMTVKITANRGSVHAGTLFEQKLVVPAAIPVTTALPTAHVPTPDTAARVSAPEAAARVSVTSASAAEPAPLPMPALHRSTPASEPVSVAKPLITPMARIAPAPEADPSVSITNTPHGEKVHSGSGKTKWIIIAAVAAGAGIGVAMMGGHGKSAATSTASTTSIGTPSISVGAP